MSVDFAKLNKPGLGGASFGSNRKTSTVQKQASQNLATSSGSTSTVFSFRNTRGKNFVPGRNTVSGNTRYNYSNARMSLNRSYTPPSVSNTGSHTSLPNIKINNNNDFQKGMIIGQTVIAGLNAVTQLVGAFGAAKSSMSVGNQLSAAMQGLGGTPSLSSGGGIPTAVSLSSATAQAAVNSMSSATTAGDLSTAIASAEGEYSKMQANDGTLKADADKAQKELSTLQSNVGKAEANVESLTNTVADGEQQITGLETELNKLDAGYADASKTLTTKEGQLDNAKSSASDLRAQYNAAPAEQKATLKAQLDIAEDNVKRLEGEVEKAKEAKQKALDAVGDKKSEIQEAEQKLDDKKEQVKEAKDGLAKAKKDAEAAKKALDGANGAIKKYHDNSKDMSALKKAIDDNKKRLEKLQKSEIKEFGKLGKAIASDEAQNAKLAGKIDGSDGYSGKEIKRQGKIDQNNQENALRRERTETIALSQLKLQPFTKGTDGNEYRKVDIGGETFYSRNNQLISAEEYNQGVGLS